jgi:hypothetical protein
MTGSSKVAMSVQGKSKGAGKGEAWSPERGCWHTAAEQPYKRNRLRKVCRFVETEACTQNECRLAEDMNPEPKERPRSTGNRIQRVRMNIAATLTHALLRRAFQGHGCFRRERLDRGLPPRSADPFRRNFRFAETAMPNAGEKDNCSGLRRQARANLSSGAPEFQDFTHRLVSECCCLHERFAFTLHGNSSRGVREPTAWTLLKFQPRP